MCPIENDKQTLEFSPKEKYFGELHLHFISGIMDREHLTSIGKFEHLGIINGRRKKGTCNNIVNYHY